MKKGAVAQSRREFLKRAGPLGALMCLAPASLFPLRRASMALWADDVPPFRCRSVSINRLAQLQEWMDRLDRAGRLSRNKTWRGYIGGFQYGPPADMAHARSLIVMAAPLKISRIAFRPSGQKKTALIPSGYVDDGSTLDDFRDRLYRGGIVPAGSRLEPARLPLKQLAARSGLAAYGRNNITFVDGYGSFHQLLAFYSEQGLEDHWGPPRMLRLCKGCSICLQDCPTGAIRREDFIIDPARCLSLYNELADPMPAWIPPAAHNALIGCLGCQLACPGNEEGIREQWDLGEVTETETAALLGGRPDAATERALKEKFARIGGGDNLAYIARNLKLLLRASSTSTAT